MVSHKRLLNLGLLALSVGGLAAGLASAWMGRADWASWLMLAGTVPVLAAYGRQPRQPDAAGGGSRHHCAALDRRRNRAAGIRCRRRHWGDAVRRPGAGGFRRGARDAGDDGAPRPRPTHRASLQGRRARGRPAGRRSAPETSLLVRAGETVPADGIVRAGTAVLDEVSPDRRGAARVARPGEALRSGVVNAGGPFDMQATASAADSTLAGIVRLVKAAQEAKAPSARLADRAAFVFTPLAVAVAAGAWLMSGDPVRGLAVMVAATPCPLILGVPVAIVAGLSRCAGRGVLVKGGGALERAGAGADAVHGQDRHADKRPRPRGRGRGGAGRCR